jgi:GT2 family glycosyltransferase
LKLSVIILNYNVRFFLEQCIVSVQRALTQIPGEIIVVDNNSQDDSVAMVREKFPEITLLANTENVGFSKANNQGVAVAKGEYVCILNPDMVLGEDTLEKVLDFIQKQENPGAVGVKLIDGTGNFLPESKRNIPTPKVSYLKMLGKNHPQYPYYAQHIAEDQVGEVAVLVGAFMLLKREVYIQVGGFDEDYFMYGEDIDLSYKLLRAGYKNYYFGKTAALHYKGESTTKDRVYFDRFYGAMNIFYQKHFQTNNLYKWLIKLGVWAMKNFKSFVAIPPKVKTQTPNSTVVVSENKELIDTIKSWYQPVEIQSFSGLSKSPFQNKLVIFDASYISYEEIFSLIQKNNNLGNQFRIKPEGANYLIGSDSSISKGEVKQL